MNTTIRPMLLLIVSLLPILAACASARPRTTGEVVDDARVASLVRARIAGESLLDAVRIEVDSRDGVVTLWGTVPTSRARARAAEAAGEVRGVSRVRNRIRVGR